MLLPMGDWVKVEFWAQVSDGLRIAELDEPRVSDEMARFFGFSRVAHLTVSQTNDGAAPTTRTLYENRPTDWQQIWPST
jgi:hypothetical protein